MIRTVQRIGPTRWVGTDAVQGSPRRPVLGAIAAGDSRAAVDIVTAIAVGKQGDASHLNERHKAQETPNARKLQSEFVFAV